MAVVSLTPSDLPPLPVAEPWGQLPDGTAVHLFRLQNEHGVQVHISTLGGTVTHLLVPDRTGQPGDVVLDPFFGTGTTGAVAKRLGRRWIGIERELGYVDAAMERIAAALPLDESALATMQSPRSAPKVAFGVLVENGFLTPGTVLVDAKRRFAATVRADGSLLSACGASGSIHKLGSALQNAPACNGWTFWHHEVAGTLQPIDAVRQTYLLATQP